MSERSNVESGAGHARRSANPRKPLVIDGTARRIDDGRPRGLIQGMNGSRGQSRPSQGPRPTGEPSFFKRRTEPEIDLFRHGGAHRRAGPDEAANSSPQSRAPLTIAIVAGVFTAVLLILPSLFGLAVGNAAPQIEAPTLDASPWPS